MYNPPFMCHSVDMTLFCGNILLDSVNVRETKMLTRVHGFY